MRKLMLIAGLVAAGPAISAEQADRFDLVCLGGGAANKVAYAQANVWNSYGGYGSADVIGNRAVPFDDQVNLWIEAGEGRLRMPRSMLPPIHGGEDGWFKLKSIKVGENEITASVAVNFANNPKLRIDRLTGAISISGKAGDFSGQCQKYDPATVQRAF